MNRSIHFDEKTTVLFLSVEGMVTKNDFIQVSTETVKHIINHNTNRLVVHMSEIQSDMSLADIYDVPRIYESLSLPRTLKIAFVIPEDFDRSSDMEFYKSVCRNLGYRVHIFTAQHAAIEWLTASSSK